jgi:hypothetical protein
MAGEPSPSGTSDDDKERAADEAAETATCHRLLADLTLRRRHGMASAAQGCGYDHDRWQAWLACSR